MTEYTPSNDLDTNFEMLNIPTDAFHNKKNKLCANNIRLSTICYLNTLYFTLLISQFFIIYVVFAIYSSDFNMLLKDAKTNMKDLSLILPEVSNVLQIVRQICDAPEYAPYCHSDIDTI